MDDRATSLRFASPITVKIPHAVKLATRAAIEKKIDNASAIPVQYSSVYSLASIASLTSFAGLEGLKSTLISVPRMRERKTVTEAKR